MISKLVRQLEQFKNRIPDYENLISKILLREPKGAIYILEKIIKLLNVNSKIKVLSLKNLGISTGWYELRFILGIEFTCNGCKKLSQEEINLTSIGGNYLCSECQDLAYDAEMEAHQIDEWHDREADKKLKEEFDAK